MGNPTWLVSLYKGGIQTHRQGGIEGKSYEDEGGGQSDGSTSQGVSRTANSTGRWGEAQDTFVSQPQREPTLPTP